MVNLRIGQEDAGDRRSTDIIDLIGSELLELLTRVGRGVDEKPRSVVPAYGQRRLRTRARAHTGARGLARLAMAVPLRKASAGSRAQNADAHGRGFRLLPVVQVGGDLGAQLDELKLRLDPRHIAS